MLRDFQQKTGKQIYVVTAGHDVNAEPYGFNENGRFTVEGTAYSELYSYYKDFGYDRAIDFNREHLSYVADLSDDGAVHRYGSFFNTLYEKSHALKPFIL